MKKILLFTIIFAIIFLFVFRSLILNFNKNLLDWFDFPFITWTIYQNIAKIKSFSFNDYFTTNAFYPNKMTLLFSDILLPQSIISLPFALLISNPINVVNILFIISFLLNFIACYLFWDEVFNNSTLAFIGSLFLIFSPILHLQISHFQMQSYWPFFLSLYFLFKFKKKNNNKYLILSGIFISIQFLASIYLAVFLITTICIYYLSLMVFNKKLKRLISSLIILLLVFIFIDGIFIFNYLKIKTIYSIKRDYGEYVTYSAHLSDYIFTSGINSIVHKSLLMNKWNAFNKHVIGERAAFPGFLFTICALFGLISIRKNKNQISIMSSFNQEQCFFIMLMIIGFIFSLGPRINFNGNYSYIPLPYSILIKLIPFLNAIRALARWSFLFYLGIIYFCLVFIHNKIKNKFFILIILFIFIMEYLPLNISTHSERYINNDDQRLKQYCQDQKKILLEIPVTHLFFKDGPAAGLNYISKIQLASLYHGCYIINGYSGYDLPSLIKLDQKINEYLASNQYQKLIKELHKLNIDYVKFNSNNINVKTNLQLPSLISIND